MRDDKAPVFWYVDGEFVAKVPPEKLFCEPTIGKHRIIVTDGRDQMAQVHIYVETLLKSNIYGDFYGDFCCGDVTSLYRSCK